MRKYNRFILFSLIFLAELMVLAFNSRDQIRYPNVYLIPDGYEGWVFIVYDQPGMPPIRLVDKQYIYEIPESGILNTSTEEIQYGAALDEYSFIDSNGRRTKIDQERMIHGSAYNGAEKVEFFFVGSEEEFEDAEDSYHAYRSPLNQR